MTSVAVIGGGPAGLVAAKECLEAGLDPVVFEKSSGIGGLWRARNGSMWPGLHTNLSRYTCSFSDFPWAHDAPDFPSTQLVESYLRSYARNFGILPNLPRKRLRLNTDVTAITPNWRGWLVSSKTSDGANWQENFDCVIVASGFFSRPYIPPVTGFDLFGGPKIHSAGYRSAAAFKDQRVAVIGSAFSGNEIAADLAGAGVNVAQIVRTPNWVLGRTMPGGDLPIDLALYKRPPPRPSETPQAAYRRKNSYFAATFGNPGDSHEGLRLDPGADYPIGVAVADGYLDYVRKGRIAIYESAAKGFGEHHVHLDNGAAVEADTVIFATGYRLNLPFFDDDMKARLDYKPDDSLMPVILHKETFAPTLPPGIAFVGVYRGPYLGAMELQARWTAAVFSGCLPPPDKLALQAGLEEACRIRALRPRPQFPRGDYVGFCDDIATALGVLPVPEDGTASQPVIPPHYRLRGMGQKPDIARCVMEELDDRLKRPVTRKERGLVDAHP